MSSPGTPASRIPMVAIFLAASVAGSGAAYLFHQGGLPGNLTALLQTSETPAAAEAGSGASLSGAGELAEDGLAEDGPAHAAAPTGTAGLGGGEVPAPGIAARIVDPDADDVPEEILRLAAAEWGYTPLGGLADHGVETGSLGRLSAGDIEVVSSTEIVTPEGRFPLVGVVGFHPEDVCETTDGVAFDCEEWGIEGLEMLLDSASIRCALADEGTAIACETQVGGAWFDVGGWTVKTGINRADQAGPYVLFEHEAMELGLGIWGIDFWPHVPDAETPKIREEDLPVDDLPGLEDMPVSEDMPIVE